MMHEVDDPQYAHGAQAVVMERHTRQGQGRGEPIPRRTEVEAFDLLDDPAPEPRRRRAKGTAMQVLSTGGCWCGGRIGHDWPGKSEGEPHPRPA